MPTLQYLDFDYSEDAQGVSTWDTMASVPLDRAPAVLAEIAQVLNWAHAEFPHGLAPLDEGGEWNYDLQGQHETITALHWQHHDQGHCTYQPAAQGSTRLNVSLSLCATEQVSARFREVFEL